MVSDAAASPSPTALEMVSAVDPDVGVPTVDSVDVPQAAINHTVAQAARSWPGRVYMFVLLP
jgi:hypothetical protein